MKFLKGLITILILLREITATFKGSHERLVPFVNCYQTESGKKVGLIDLNSAWMYRRDYKRQIAIGGFQIKKLLFPDPNELSKKFN